MGCKTTAPIIIQKGVFIHKYRDGDTDQLILNNDNSFYLKFSYKQGCDGKWEYISKDTIAIKYQPVDWTEMITRGYMHERELKIKVLNNNKIKLFFTNNGKMDYIILERVDSLSYKYL